MYKAHCVGEWRLVCSLYSSSVWVYAALLSFGIFWACIGYTLGNHSFTDVLLFFTCWTSVKLSSPQKNALQSICCQSAVLYLFAMGTFVPCCQSVSANHTPITTLQITFPRTVKSCSTAELHIFKISSELQLGFFCVCKRPICVQAIATSQRFKWGWPLWLCCWDYFDLSYFCSYW